MLSLRGMRSFTCVHAGPCVWNRAMAEGLALATCLGKLNISLLELFFFLELVELFQLQPHRGGSAGHIHHCQTELKMHLEPRSRATCVTAVCPCSVSHHMQFPTNVLSIFLNRFPDHILKLHLQINIQFQFGHKKSTFSLWRVLSESTRWAHGADGRYPTKGLPEHSRNEETNLTLKQSPYNQITASKVTNKGSLGKRWWIKRWKLAAMWPVMAKGLKAGWH